MTRPILVMSTIYCLLLLCFLTRGYAQANSSHISITETRVILSSPTRVELTCVANSRFGIQSVLWEDSTGSTLNSTTIQRTNGQSTTATLLVEREACSIQVYSCVFETVSSLIQEELNCPPVPDVVFTSPAYTVVEGAGQLQVCLNVTNTSLGTVLTIEETDFTATRRVDFILARMFNLTVTPDLLVPVADNNCAPGGLCGQLCFTIPIIQDRVFEFEQESFVLEMRVGDVLVRSSSETTVYIEDDDELVIGFESPHFTFQEGDEGCSSKVRVCAELSGSITGLSVELVPVWREGTAMEGLDYYPPPCNFSFPVGGYVDCMDLTLINDDVVERTETLSVGVASVWIDGMAVRLGERVRVGLNETVIHITDNDVFELMFDEFQYMIREPGHGESHTALRVCLILGREGAQTAELGGASLIAELIISTRDGSATGGEDFAPLNNTLSVTLPLSGPVCECVLLLPDSLAESTEHFSLQLHSSHPMVTTEGVTARASIKDGIQPVVRVGFQRSEYTTSEDDGSVEVCVTLTGQHQRSISIYVCTQSGTAVQDLDFDGIHNHRLTFPAVPLSSPQSRGVACLNITVLNDALLEGKENFTLMLGSSDTAVLLTTHTTVISILNSHGTLPSLTFVNNTPSVMGNIVSAQFTLTHSHQLSSLHCTLSGPGRTSPIAIDCLSGHVTFTNLPLRRQEFTLEVTAYLQSNTPQPMILSTLDLRLDHSVCWLHPINRGVVQESDRVIVEWQATGPTAGNKVQLFLCRRDRERNERPCTSPYTWENPSPGNHLLFVTPFSTPGCRRHITREFEFTSVGH